MTSADAAGTSGRPSHRPVTVVHLITTLTQGGAERVLTQLVPRPADVTDERHVVISLVPGGMFADELAADGVEVRDLGMRPGRDPLRGTLRLARMLRELRPTMVVSWMYHASLIDLLARPFASRARRARMVWMVRGSLSARETMPRSSRMVLHVLARMSRRPEAIATNSVAGRRQHEEFGFHPRAWLHLPNACDSVRFSPDPDVRVSVRSALGVAADDLVILFVGRNHPEKGFDLLLDALRRFDTAQRSTVVILVGHGTDEAERLDAASCRVLALGERTDVADLLRGADALVLPSRSEGTPNAVLEAMSTGVPCLVTDVGDSADVVGSEGIVIGEVTVEGIVAGLETLVAMGPDELRRRGTAARERASRRHDPDVARAQYRALWAEPDR